jgi:hypothetical protein
LQVFSKQTWGFDSDTFHGDQERSKKLLQKWYKDLIELLQNEAWMPRDIAFLTLEQAFAKKS